MRRTRFTHRCRACFVRITETDGCAKHPTAERLPWPLSMTHAYRAVLFAHEAGRDLDTFVETFRPDDWPGVEKGDMALAALLFKQRECRDLPERELPPGTDRSPVGLYS